MKRAQQRGVTLRTYALQVIDAGRFDMQTSMAERKETLEQMLQVCGSC